MIDVDNINLQIDNIDFWSKNSNNKGGMRIYWSSNFGFGTLDIYKESGNDEDDETNPEEEFVLMADTECIDTQENKSFTKKLLSLLADKLIVTE